MTSVQREKDNGKGKASAYKAEPYKTDFRRDVIAKRREMTRAAHQLTREKTQDRKLHGGKTVSRSVVSIDTHRARSNVDVLRMVIRDLGWREFPFLRRDHNCDVTWHAVSFHDQPDIYSGQVNKFPGALEIFQKVNLFRWLEFMKNLFPEEYDFFPKTWLLPQQFHEFSHEVRTILEKKPKQKPTYIAKPSDGSQGDGIYLLRDPQQFTNTNGRSYVVQEYINNVLLIDKYKFDFRIYVVLRSLDPLEFHICKDGLARFSTIPYEQPTNKNMNEVYMHLTNYSLNKKSSDFKISQKDDEGSKRKLTAVLKQMQKMGHDTELIWQKIEHLVTKTLIAVAGELKVEYLAAIPTGKPGPTCFQVLGFDVLLMKDLQPILLEVNSNPSLSITEEHETATGGVEYVISSKDEDVKRKLIRDTLILIAPKNKYTRKRRRHRRRRRQRYSDEEDMDTDQPVQRRNRRRERDISIKYMDMEEEKMDRQKSIFDDIDYTPKRFVRNETCRVFIEGEGEVFFTDDGPSNPKYFGDYRTKDNSKDGGSGKKNGNNTSAEVPMDTSDRLPSVFMKSGEKPADEDDVENNPPRPLPFDLSLLDSSDESDEEEESCLKEIFPTLYAEEFKDARIVERLADIFITCLGVKGCLRLGPTMFRLFARKCRLNRKGITNAAIDILYIDMQRKWEYMNPDRTSGLRFYAFLESCRKIAQTTFYGSSLLERLENFLEHCERFLALSSELEEQAVLKAARRREERSFTAWISAGDKEARSGKLTKARTIVFDDDDDFKMPNSKAKMTENWPQLLDETYEDRSFPTPHRQHRNVFHLLQSLKK